MDVNVFTGHNRSFHFIYFLFRCCFCWNEKCFHLWVACKRRFKISHSVMQSDWHASTERMERWTNLHLPSFPHPLHTISNSPSEAMGYSKWIKIDWLTAQHHSTTCRVMSSITVGVRWLAEMTNLLPKNLDCCLVAFTMWIVLLFDENWFFGTQFLFEISRHKLN